MGATGASMAGACGAVVACLAGAAAAALAAVEPVGLDVAAVLVDEVLVDPAGHEEPLEEGGALVGQLVAVGQLAAGELLARTGAHDDGVVYQQALALAVGVRPDLGPLHLEEVRAGRVVETGGGLDVHQVDGKR